MPGRFFVIAFSTGDKWGQWAAANYTVCMALFGWDMVLRDRVLRNKVLLGWGKVLLGKALLGWDRVLRNKVLLGRRMDCLHHK